MPDKEEGIQEILEFFDKSFKGKKELCAFSQNILLRNT